MGKIDSVLTDVENYLERDSRGLTIQEIADHANCSRITASMALMKLEGMGTVTVRRVGNCKLHYLKK